MAIIGEQQVQIRILENQVAQLSDALKKAEDNSHQTDTQAAE